MERRRPRLVPHRDHRRHPPAARSRPQPTAFLVDACSTPPARRAPASGRASTRSDMGIPANAIAEAVFARCLSAFKDERVAAAKVLKGPPRAPYQRTREAELVEAVRDALYCSKICAYAQGFQLMRRRRRNTTGRSTSATIAAIWRGGCIIRARFLQKITEAYHRNPGLVNLMLDPYFKRRSPRAREPGARSWRSRCGTASRCPPSAARCPTSTATDRRGSRPISSRPSAITSAPTPTSAWTRRAGSSSTWTGRTRSDRSSPSDRRLMINVLWFWAARGQLARGALSRTRLLVGSVGRPRSGYRSTWGRRRWPSSRLRRNCRAVKEGGTPFPTVHIMRDTTP